MPPKQEKQPAKQSQKKVNTAPSQSWWQRMFGSQPMTPGMEEGLRIARGEIPDLGNVQTYGPISKLLMPGAAGYTSPGKSIYLNADVMQGYSPQEIANTLLHEQTHVRQMKERGLNPLMEFAQSIGGDPYHRRPDEMAAYAAETERAKRMNMSPPPVPSFLTGEMNVPRDIRLRANPPTVPSPISPTMTPPINPTAPINTQPSPGILQNLFNMFRRPDEREPPRNITGVRG